MPIRGVLAVVVANVDSDDTDYAASAKRP